VLPQIQLEVCTTAQSREPASAYIGLMRGIATAHSSVETRRSHTSFAQFAQRPPGGPFPGRLAIAIVAALVTGIATLSAWGNGGREGAAQSAANTDPPALLCQITAQCSGQFKKGVKSDCELSVADGNGAALYADHASLAYRGRSSLEFPKKNYALELRDASGTKAPTDLLGMGKDPDWILDGSWADRSFMRNPLVLDTYASFGRSRYGAKSRFCTLTLNGASQGIYRLGEKVKRSDARLALAADDGTGASFIIKQDDTGVLLFDAGGQKTWQLVYPAQDVATTAQRAGVQAWLDQLTAALNGADPGNTTNGVFTLLDLDTTVDWVLIQEFSKNVDAYNYSLHLARDAGRPGWLVPWDFDLTFGQPTITGAGPKASMNDAPSGWVPNRTPFIVNLSKASQLTAGMAARWQTLRQGTLSDAAIAQRLATYQTTLTPEAVARNFAVWPLSAVAFQQIYAPYTLYHVDSYTDECAKLSTWIKARLAWMDAHVASYPN
jgi:spore coat protein H